MDQPTSGLPTGDGTDDGRGLLAAGSAFSAEGPSSTHGARTSKETSHKDFPHHGQRRWRKTRYFFKKLLRVGPDRAVELGIAIVVVIFSGSQLYITVANARGNTDQTNQLIAASKFNAYAADQNAQASRNFAESARGINQGVNDAVGRLQAQANNTQKLAENASRQADATRALADEAQRQADFAKAQADASKTIAERSVAQANATNRLADAAGRSAVEASKETELLQRQLETAQRAWIAKTGQTFELLHFASSGSFYYSYRVAVTNNGNIPAVDIKLIQGGFLVNMTDQLEILEKAKIMQRQLCQRADHLDPRDFVGVPKIIYPGKFDTLPVGLGGVLAHIW